MIIASLNIPATLLIFAADRFNSGRNSRHLSTQIFSNITVRSFSALSAISGIPLLIYTVAKAILATFLHVGTLTKSEAMSNFFDSSLEDLSESWRGVGRISLIILFPNSTALNYEKERLEEILGVLH